MLGREKSSAKWGNGRVGIVNEGEVRAAQDGLPEECLLNEYLKEEHAKNAQGECLAPNMCGDSGDVKEQPR